MTIDFTPAAVAYLDGCDEHAVADDLDMLRRGEWTRYDIIEAANLDEYPESKQGVNEYADALVEYAITNTVEICGIRFARVVAELVERMEENVAEDFENLIGGITDEEGLVDHCIQGIETENEPEWRDYVATLSSYATFLRQASDDVRARALAAGIIGLPRKAGTP